MMLLMQAERWRVTLERGAVFSLQYPRLRVSLRHPGIGTQWKLGKEARAVPQPPHTHRFPKEHMHWSMWMLVTIAHKMNGYPGFLSAAVIDTIPKEALEERICLAYNPRLQSIMREGKSGIELEAMEEGCILASSLLCSWLAILFRLDPIA